MSRQRTECGITLIELLISLLAASILIGGALQFFSGQFGTVLVQRQISDMQQNARAALDDITIKLRNAGANLPAGLPAFVTADTNPDTLSIRYAPFSGSVPVGWASTANSSTPIEIDIAIDISAFSADQHVYIWYSDKSEGEWFYIKNIVTNAGSGRHEIYHIKSPLKFNPGPGHFLVALRSSRYYVDATDTLHPLLMRAENGTAPELYADDIEDLQFQYVLSGGDTVETLGANDSVYFVRVALTARTHGEDIRSLDAGVDGYRHRTLETGVMIRNNRP